MYRGIAQLVERVVWDHEVARSNRVTPTTILRVHLLEYQSFTDLILFFVFLSTNS